MVQQFVAEKLERHNISVNVGELKWVAVSDLHLTTGDDAEDGDAEALDFVLRWLIGAKGGAYQRIWWVGDIFDVVETKTGEDVNGIIEAHLELFELMSIGIYLNGNHEKGLVPITQEFDDSVPGVHVEHGHKADFWYTGWLRHLFHFGAWVTGWLERLGWKDIDRQTPAGMNPSELKLYQPKMESYYEDYFKSHPETKVIICGHTHRPGLFTYSNGRVVANCGSMLKGGQKTFLLLYKNVIELWVIKKKRTWKRKKK